jgi:hypothetical protein
MTISVAYGRSANAVQSIIESNHCAVASLARFAAGSRGSACGFDVVAIRGPWNGLLAVSRARDRLCRRCVWIYAARMASARDSADTQ